MASPVRSDAGGTEDGGSGGEANIEGGDVSVLVSLVAALLLLWVGDGWPWLVAGSVVAAAWAGTTLPDLDLRLRLGHRSALLHSVLPMALAAIDRRTWPVAAGLGLGIGLHLSADLFPATMRGYATVKLPLFGSYRRGRVVSVDRGQRRRSRWRRACGWSKQVASPGAGDGNAGDGGRDRGGVPGADGRRLVGAGAVRGAGVGGVEVEASHSCRNPTLFL